MTFAIGTACVEVQDRSCVDVCPVDCIYEGDRKLYINPDECIDCGACMTECPAKAVIRIEDVLDVDREAVADNARFFLDILPGRTEPIGSPGDSRAVGRVGVDTPFIQEFVAQAANT